MKLLDLYSSPLPCYLVPLRPKYILGTVLSNILNLHFTLSVRVQVSHPYKTTGKVIVLYIFIPFLLVDSKLGGKIFRAEW
jgi:hypothetical protein